MLTIRLQRVGKKNNAHFRLVLAEKATAVKKQVTEVLGSYNPHSKELVIRDQARLDYWINDQHVELSATAQNLLVGKELVKMDKTKAFTIPKKEVVATEADASAESSSSEVKAEETGATEPEVVPEATVPETKPEEESSVIEKDTEVKAEESAPEVKAETEITAESPEPEAPVEVAEQPTAEASKSETSTTEESAEPKSE